MSLPPITIPDLDPAGTVDRVNDLVLLRQGLNDKKATVQQISSIALGDYGSLGTPIVASDVLLIGRNAGPGVYNNFIFTPQRLGFLVNTVMWFWMPAAPDFWVVEAGSGDKVLATALAGGQPYQYTAPGYFGDWQQDGVNGGKPGSGLTLTQIPNHNHWAQFGHDRSDKNAQYIEGAKKHAEAGDINYSNQPVAGVVGGFNDTGSHRNYGGCDPHNHGAIWRPAAAVGLLCRKIG
jgi:hypothetical protein